MLPICIMKQHYVYYIFSLINRYEFIICALRNYNLDFKFIVEFVHLLFFNILLLMIIL
jgi:hypothetical protein